MLIATSPTSIKTSDGAEHPDAIAYVALTHAQVWPEIPNSQEKQVRGSITVSAWHSLNARNEGLAQLNGYPRVKEYVDSDAIIAMGSGISAILNLTPTGDPLIDAAAGSVAFADALDLAASTAFPEWTPYVENSNR
jgi:hypothetical protein